MELSNRRLPYPILLQAFAFGGLYETERDDALRSIHSKT